MKKIFPFLTLLLIMAVCILPQNISKKEVLADWTDYVEAPQKDGDTYIINSANNLAWLSKEVNSGNTYHNAKLVRDIDLAGKNWVPIALDYGYNGTFDGCGFEIKNLTIKNMTSHAGYCGLFGNLANGYIKNVVLTNVNIDVEEEMVGGIVGLISIKDSADYKVTNCMVTGNIDNSYDRNRYDYYSLTGGIAGESYNIRDCIFKGNITSIGRAGGITGSPVGNVYRCMASGVINANTEAWSGGIAGICEDGAIIEECSFVGSVYGDIQVGGLIGGVYSTDVASVINCFSMSDLYGGVSAAGICYHEQVSIRNCYFKGTLSANSVADIGNTVTNSYRYNSKPSSLPAGFDSSIWVMKSSINGGYPVLKWCYWELSDALNAYKKG